MQNSVIQKRVVPRYNGQDNEK
uniref:Uncharacterized protein n=1 Tax=Triticum urartu TaxID=4572 RepID=A0A8R7UMF8_TRIUA